MAADSARTSEPDTLKAAIQTGEWGYLNLLREVLTVGEERSDRTGVGVRGVFGRQIRFDLDQGFPMLTTKRLPFKAIALELLWFLRGDTNVRWLQERGVTIWDEWADADGDLGPVYGKQWRSWAAPDGQTIDQIALLQDALRRDPFSRRHVVSAWNPADLPAMALAPCHCLFQFHVSPGGRLSCQLYQRSADLFLGVPFNIASYSLLTLMMAEILGLKPGDFVHSFGDAHLYLNHIDQAKTQLEREPRPFPHLCIKTKRADLFSFEFEDFELADYDPHPHIKADVAV